MRKPNLTTIARTVVTVALVGSARRPASLTPTTG